MAKLIWFRSDLRLRDNPAVHYLLQQVDSETPVYGIYLYSTKQWQQHDWAPIKVDLLWRHLECLQQDAAQWGISLHLVEIDDWHTAPKALWQFCQQQGITEVAWNTEYPVHEQRRDRAVQNWLREQEIGVQTFHGLVVVPPVLRTQAGDYYKKFTPYYRSWLAHIDATGLAQPYQKPMRKAVSPPAFPSTVDYPRRDSSAYVVGEEACYRQLERFVAQQVDDYHQERDLPALTSTSKLSPYFELGCLSPITAARQLQQHSPHFPHGLSEGAQTWLSELAWREFYQHLMLFEPRLSYGKAFQPHTDGFAWRNDEAQFAAWCEGRTGYPIVDAGMRQLRVEGWMHNRVRMIVANFLVKDLHIDWRWGEAFFMRHLIDGSFPANNGGWQWSASTGTDAVPYFRVFNPTAQSKKVDPDGSYIRTYVKELSECPASKIHEPQDWVRVTGGDYPPPIVDHAKAREGFLSKFKAL